MSSDIFVQAKASDKGKECKILIRAVVHETHV